ncbi:3-isopropylmalate dehydratase small subunit [Thermogymnomonas acidicola]|uniref:3-isopropylmalate dehydratase small subunit n=1 Tax=Thermogymnomonas acidicola TaxID=399579 RepID=A0AA37BRS7_9ARCH|nr:3-isopropylmalate dehydratase [Thermogymnomonas acidicola]GGM75946.1 3-isopropylmalate dehydratase small subunit [Thermogymnomonas acidicola]
MTAHRVMGRAWVFGDNVNTDNMYPHICYTLPERDRPKYTMWANRPGWAEQVRPGDLLVAGKNFGLGSSRPAATNLLMLGIRAVFAESVNGLFLRNAVNVGLPAVAVPGITSAVTEGQTLEADLDEGWVRTEEGEEIRFRPLPAFLMEIIDAGGIIEVLRARGLLSEEPL